MRSHKDENVRLIYFTVVFERTFFLKQKTIEPRIQVTMSFYWKLGLDSDVTSPTFAIMSSFNLYINWRKSNLIRFSLNSYTWINTFLVRFNVSFLSMFYYVLNFNTLLLEINYRQSNSVKNSMKSVSHNSNKLPDISFSLLYPLGTPLRNFRTSPTE